MDRADYWVGIDAGKTEAAICLLAADGSVLFECIRAAQPGPICDVFRPFGVEHVRLITIEAGVGTHIARILTDRGYPVQIVDTRKASKFLTIRRDKTDVNDARGLAELGRFGQSMRAGVLLKPHDIESIKVGLSVRKHLIYSRMRTDSVIRAILQARGVTFQLRSSLHGMKMELNRFLASPHDLDQALFLQLAPLTQMAEQLRIQIERQDRELTALAKANPVTANLQTMPGVGPITALTYYSAISDPWRFKRNRDIGAYLGLVPTRHQSGNLARRGHIGRFGNKPTRICLILGASTVLRRSKAESRIRDWGTGLEQRIGFGKARIAVARKMAVIMLQMWKSTTAFRPL